MKKELTLGLGVIVISLISGIVAPPVDTKKPKHTDDHDSEKPGEKDLGLEYGRYLQQVVEALEKDPDFAKKLENVSADDIKTGKVAKELEFVKHNIRSKLDELKRIELDRLRSLARRDMERNELGFDRDQARIPQHLDYRNPHTFEIEDLKKLIKTASNDLDELNAQRKEEFKQYELEKEHAYRDKLKHMSEQERKEEEAKHQASEQRHKEHPKVHHPGSKQQLEQVWEEHDQLPKEEFNPSTFFAMHDINGDGHLDEEEVEAILSLEIKKMYDPNNTDDDPMEMMEEYHRMREHIYNETDTNKDGLISKQEFMDMTRRAEFNQDDGWKGLDEENVFSEDDLAAYERMQEEQMRQMAMGQQYHAGVPPGGYQYHPQQGIPNEAQHQQGYPNQVGGGYHPQQGGLQPPHLQQGQPQFQQHQGQPQFQQHQGQPQFQQHQGQPQFQQHQGQPQFQQNQGQPQFQQQNQGQPQFQQQNQGQQQHPQGALPPHQQQFQQGQGQYAQGQGGQFQQQQGLPPPHIQQGVPPVPHIQQGVPHIANQVDPNQGHQGAPLQPPHNAQPIQQNQQGLPVQNAQANNGQPPQQVQQTGSQPQQQQPAKGIS